mmetsp:Transcript_1629/g.4879  ORF Transcript_1629/g.4879 Transcript_1629/m.4879 type:complete len:249 (-) Transcript_1629:2136-2882(-)
MLPLAPFADARRLPSRRPPPTRKAPCRACPRGRPSRATTPSPSTGRSAAASRPSRARWRSRRLCRLRATNGGPQSTTSARRPTRARRAPTWKNAWDLTSRTWRSARRPNPRRRSDWPRPPRRGARRRTFTLRLKVRTRTLSSRPGPPSKRPTRKRLLQDPIAGGPLWARPRGRSLCGRRSRLRRTRKRRSASRPRSGPSGRRSSRSLTRIQKMTSSFNPSPLPSTRAETNTKTSLAATSGGPTTNGSI